MGAILSVAAIGTSVASIGLQAYGAYSQGQAAKAGAEYNRRVALRNAEAVRIKSQFDQLRQLRKAAQLKGQLRSRLGASGTVLTEGSPLAIQAEQAMELDLENALIGYEGMNQASQLRTQAEGFRFQGRNAAKAGNIGVGTSLLTGFNTMYNSGQIDQIGSWFKGKGNG